MARGGAFLLVPVCMACGAVTYFELSGEPHFKAILSGMAVMGISYHLAKARLALRLCAAAGLLFLAGMLAGKIETWRLGTKMLGSAVTTRMTGIVRNLEYAHDGRTRLVVEIADTRRPRLRYQPDRVKVSAVRIPADIRPGTGITGLVRLFPARGPLTPGGYDFAFENYFSGIGANGFFLGTPRRADITGTARGAYPVSALIENIRLDIYNRIISVLPGEEGKIAAALITGFKRGIPEGTSDALRRTGLAHILSISGLHMALAAGTIMGVLRLCFAAFPGYAARHPVKKHAAGAALIAGSAYLLVSGCGVATLRSFLMLAIMLAALLYDRAAITMRNLAIAAIVMIAVRPHEVAGPSFQMSFAATSALVAAYGAWTGRRARRDAPAGGHSRSRIAALLAVPVRYAGGLALTSVVAGTATAIFAAYHFHRIAPMGLPANLVAMPVFSALVMPPAVLALVLMPFDLEAPALELMGQGVGMVTAIAKWFADRTAGDVVGMVPAQAVALLTIALVILVTATTKWRYAALPFVIAGAIAISQRRLPEIIVSEDAELVAVRSADGTLAVNRSRPNLFIAGDWQMATMADKLAGPVGKTSGHAPLPPGRFKCAEGICQAKTTQGVSVAIVSQESRLKEACERSQVVILSDPTIGKRCGGTANVVITAKRLALLGTAFVYAGESGPHGRRGPGTGRRQNGGAGAGNRRLETLHSKITVAHAIDSVDRPWHRVRIYSRHARGLKNRK